MVYEARLWIEMEDGWREAMMDVIQWQERFWLVPTWLEHQEKTQMQPERAIPLDTLDHLDWGTDPKSFLVREQLPRRVFFDEPTRTEAGRYEIAFLPDVYRMVGVG